MSCQKTRRDTLDGSLDGLPDAKRQKTSGSRRAEEPHEDGERRLLSVILNPTQKGQLGSMMYNLSKLEKDVTLIFPVTKTGNGMTGDAILVSQIDNAKTRHLHIKVSCTMKATEEYQWDMCSDGITIGVQSMSLAKALRNDYDFCTLYVSASDPSLLQVAFYDNVDEDHIMVHSMNMIDDPPHVMKRTTLPIQVPVYMKLRGDAFEPIFTYTQQSKVDIQQQYSGDDDRMMIFFMTATEDDKYQVLHLITKRYGKRETWVRYPVNPGNVDVEVLASNSLRDVPHHVKRYPEKPYEDDSPNEPVRYRPPVKLYATFNLKKFFQVLTMLRVRTRETEICICASGGPIRMRANYGEGENQACFEITLFQQEE